MQNFHSSCMFKLQTDKKQFPILKKPLEPDLRVQQGEPGLNAGVGKEIY